MPSLAARALWTGAEFIGVPGRRLDDAAFELAGPRFQASNGFAVKKGRWIDPADLAANLAVVRAAAAASDLVVFSIHAHEQGPWLRIWRIRCLTAAPTWYLPMGRIVCWVLSFTMAGRSSTVPGTLSSSRT